MSENGPTGPLGTTTDAPHLFAVPDIDEHTELERSNAARVETLVRIGLPMEQIQLIAFQVRVQALIEHLVQDPKAFELTYEKLVADTLNQVYADLTRPKLAVPGK